MSIKISSTIEEATPWNATVARLQACEERIGDFEKTAMGARWDFGKELVRRRVESKTRLHKGKQILPSDLKKLVLQQCGVSESELNYRIQFAVKFPTRKEMTNAVGHWKTWRQMISEGLVDKPRTKKAKTKAKAALPKSFLFDLKKTNQRLDQAIAHHQQLTRDEVKQAEALIVKVTALLKQIDANDAMKAESKARVS